MDDERPSPRSSSGNVTGVTEPDGDVIGYGYDEANRRDTLTYPDGSSVTYGYDAAGRVQSVSHPALGTTTYGYDGDGLLVAEDLPGADSRARSYDSAGRLSALSQTLAGVTSAYGISRDASGRVTAMTTGGPMAWDDWAFSYDAAGQLLSADRGSPGGIDDFAYAYDARGNRITKAKGGFTWTQTYNDANQLVTSQLNSYTPWTYDYDAAGRRTEARQGTTRYDYDYDATGRLDERRYVTQWWIFTSTWSEDYAYTGDGQLVGLTVTEPNHSTHDYELSWDVTAAVPEVLSIDDGGGDDSFVYGANRIGVEDADGSVATFSYDPFGSALATAETAEWARSASYSPFGQQQNAAWADPLAHAPSFGYRGELTLDNTIHLRARTYEPAEGVFTTRDPLDGTAGTTTYTSPYAYANNDPLNKTDPLGMRPGDGGSALGGFATITAEPLSRVAQWLGPAALGALGFFLFGDVPSVEEIADQFFPQLTNPSTAPHGLTRSKSGLDCRSVDMSVIQFMGSALRSAELVLRHDGKTGETRNGKTTAVAVYCVDGTAGTAISGNGGSQRRPLPAGWASDQELTYYPITPGRRGHAETNILITLNNRLPIHEGSIWLYPTEGFDPEHAAVVDAVVNAWYVTGLQGKLAGVEGSVSWSSEVTWDTDDDGRRAMVWQVDFGTCTTIEEPVERLVAALSELDEALRGEAKSMFERLVIA